MLSVLLQGYDQNQEGGWTTKEKEGDEEEREEEEKLAEM